MFPFGKIQVNLLWCTKEILCIDILLSPTEMTSFYLFASVCSLGLY